MTYTLPSGQIVEMTLGDSYAGPNPKPGGLSVNSTGSFIRVDGGPWLRGQRTQMHMRAWLEVCDNWADVIHALLSEHLIDPAHVWSQP